MRDEERQPKEYDVVLGGNNSSPVNGLVLGGIDGVKRRFANANSDKEKIAILREALKYGEEGEEFLSDVFSASKGKIQWMAAAFISATSNETYKELLVDYFADFIQNNKQDWNNWRKEVQDIQIFLKAISFGNLSVLKSRDFSNTNLINADLSYMDLWDSNFKNADLCQANLAYSYLYYACFNNAKLVGANLKQAWLDDATLLKTDLRKANIEWTHFEQATLNQIKLSDLDYSYNFESALLNNIAFSNVSLVNSLFRDSILENISFIKCNIKNTDFTGALLRQVIFDNCELTNSSFSHYSDRIREAIFKNSNLNNTDFRFANLTQVVFDNVTLKSADFRWSDLTGIDFTGLDVRGANFTRCNFGNNNLDKANTEGAKFNSIDSLRFPPNLDTSKLEGALFDDRHYYEPGYE